MAEPLSTYRAKRDPVKTPEPMGESGPPQSDPDALRFVIQEHHARALHWDFRLERDGVLVSWALPKGLPETPATNHLAVHTEDHPLDYAAFQGDIPKGEYGGGHVTVWDHGSYDLEKWSDREVKVVLHGKRASGRYVLFQTGGKNWMIHRMDPPRQGFQPMPKSIQPMRAPVGSLPENDEGWAYEFIWDGLRVLAYVDGGRVRAVGQNGMDLTASFPEIREVGAFLGSRPAVLDGAIVALEDGVPSFTRLQHRIGDRSRAQVTRLARETPVSFFAFDVLYLEGDSLVGETYDRRRDVLESLELSGPAFACPPAARDADGREIFRIAEQRGLQGIVAKRRDSLYLAGRRGDEWRKVKIRPSQTLVIGGWTAKPSDGQRPIETLLLGLPTARGLRYEGKVGSIPEETRITLEETLSTLEQKSSPFINRVAPSDLADARFVRPETVADVGYESWSAGGRLKHAYWRGLRPDKDPSDVVRA
jgi:bifunctional non-homologous end joining protein LigD